MFPAPPEGDTNLRTVWLLLQGCKGFSARMMGLRLQYSGAGIITNTIPAAALIRLSEYDDKHTIHTVPKTLF